tara:strand:+ start:383 stop:520 length:138 start_codon:yes stop_codon:yes gene_type:complete
MIDWATIPDEAMWMWSGNREIAEMYSYPDDLGEGLNIPQSDERAA